MNTSHKIIGIAGLPRSGKDSLASFFIGAGYFGVSLGDIVRDFSRIRHSDKADPISVTHMTETANWLRSERGSDFALKVALERYENSLEANPELKGLVVYSIRTPIEVDYILKHHGELIWVEATDQTRYKRAMEHLRDDEKRITLDEFTEQEKLQWRPQPDLPEEVQMNVEYVKNHSTIIFDNEVSMAEFKLRAKEFMKQF